METTILGGQLILGLVIGIVVLVALILKTKIHAFLALIIAAALTGLIGGMQPNDVVSTISKGFGNTLGSIGIIIGFGVMMGEIFEKSGAAEKMAMVFLKRLGKKREELALALTGFIVSIPIFCDSGFVVLSPLAKAISKKTKKSVVSLGVALAVGLVVTHSLVPPTPGPLGVAGLFNANVGTLILWAIPLSIPMVLAAMVYAKWIGKKIYQLPNDAGDGWIRPEYQKPILNFDTSSTKNLPSTFMAFAPILLPVILILLNTVVTALKLDSPITVIIQFIGAPVVAVGLGLIVAIYGLTRSESRKTTLENMERGIKTAGIIILVTGGGGALGQILRDGGAGQYIAELVAGTALPAILLPFIIASLVRLIQGSGTVAMITSASITAPILATMNVNPVFAALAACIGSLIFSYFNDSFFWVVNRLLGIEDAKEQIRVWSVTTTIAWAVGIVELLIVNAIFG
ncbi:GntP family permease [Cellulosilyticum sp. I15G10I2]|uniref:GntP family permease n=1 Tax=Cellulosilyticum sp. I15G10I2 TaxID=1892843 RepID=UPI00085C3153|nr:gluconate:H+ symporter [Cellulosilyticum sp. I15G10I2]